MVPTVAWMKQKFSEFNQKYFGNSLPVPEFYVGALGDVWGKYDLQASYNKATRKITRRSGNGTISLTNQYSRKENAVISTLLHEMVHEYLYLVIGIYPQDKHGREFMSVANKINGDGWKIAKETPLTDNDIEGGDNHVQEILCVVKCEGRNDFNWWICRADRKNAQAFVNRAKKIPGMKKVSFFACNTSALQHVKIDPNNLLGWSGLTYADAAASMARYCGENTNVFYGNNLKPIK